MTYLAPEQSRRAEIRGYYIVHPSTNQALRGPIPTFEQAQREAARLNAEVPHGYFPRLKEAQRAAARRDVDFVEIRVIE